MARPLKRPAAAPSPPAPPASAREPGWTGVAAAILSAVLALVVFGGAIAYGFSQDDFLGLARTAGLAPRPPGPWRLLSHQWFWDLVAGPLGRSATAAHGLVLAVHATNAGLLAWLISRRLPAAAALAGGAWFATHPALFTGLYWLAANGDVLATTFALLCVACFHARGPVRWLAVPLVVLAALAKESALALPLVLAALAWLRPRDGARPQPARDPVLLSSAAAAGVFAAALGAGPGMQGLGGEAYALSPGAAGPNALTYLGWIANRWYGTVQSFVDVPDPRVWPWAAGFAAIALAAALHPGARRAGALAAVLALLAALLPVLPLAHHTYHYYLVLPMAAAGLLVATLVAVAAEGLRPPARVLLAVAIAAGLAADGRALVDKIEHAPFVLPEMRAEPIVDRARVAANAIASLRDARLPAGTMLLVWSPLSREIVRSRGGDDSQVTYFERNLRSALLDGLALRVMVPEVDSVRFVDAFDSTAAGVRWAVAAPDGRMRVSTTAELLPVVRAAAGR